MTAPPAPGRSAPSAEAAPETSPRTRGAPFGPHRSLRPARHSPVLCSKAAQADTTGTTTTAPARTCLPSSGWIQKASRKAGVPPS